MKFTIVRTDLFAAATSKAQGALCLLVCHRCLIATISCVFRDRSISRRLSGGGAGRDPEATGDVRSTEGRGAGGGAADGGRGQEKVVGKVRDTPSNRSISSPKRSQLREKNHTINKSSQ